jgi:benzil reductase ((S)-benzoin forming)
MRKKIAIVTGGSKGIGLGIVTEYGRKGYHVLSIARSKNKTIKEGKVLQFEVDLSVEQAAEEVMRKLFSTFDSQTIERIVLFNNAGSIGQIGPLEKLELKNIEEIIRLNTIVPLQLTSLFLKLTANWPCQKKIISISSGAAVKPYFGWATYCSSKAAIDMMTKTVARELEDNQDNSSIIAIYPGVVNTAMQQLIRTCSKDEFRDVNRFVDLKNSGQLSEIESVGKAIFEIDHSSSVENGAIIDIRDWENV